MTISLVFCYLLFGFSNNSSKAINEASTRHFDYGTSTISKEFKSESNSSITLVKTVRPEENEIDDIRTKFPMFDFMINYDAVFSVGEIYLENEVNGEIRTSYVYDFSKNCFDKSLIVSGNIFTVKDALDALKITGATAVMIARGGIGNPLLIKDLQDALDGKQPEYKYTFEYSDGNGESNCLS